MSEKDIDKALPRGRRGRGAILQSHEVIDYWEAGITDVDEIASQTGRTRGEVAKFLRQAGYDVYPGHVTLLDRYKSAELEELLDDYYVRKMRVWELCAKWDIADNASFYNIIRKLGKKPRSRTDDSKDGRKAQLDHAVQLYDEHLGMTIMEIVGETGVDATTLNKELRRRGITLRRDRGKFIKAE